MKANTTGLADLKRLTEEQALALFEGLRWPDGVVCCSHCKSEDVYSLTGKQYRPGLRHCRTCRKQFSPTTGTVLESSRVKMWQWVYVFATVANAKKAASSHQIRRELGVQYKTALFMTHRVRYALKHGADAPKLTGTLEVDEFYGAVGKQRNPGDVKQKLPVVSVVSREGKMRSAVMPVLTQENVRAFLDQHTDQSGTLMSDESSLYTKLGKVYKGGHHTTKHSDREYARGNVHSNTVESAYSLLVRGLVGSFHHVSPQHLHLYVTEFDRRWDMKDLTDTERAFEFMRLVVGKRLYWRQPKGVIEGRSSLLSGNTKPATGTRPQ